MPNQLEYNIMYMNNWKEKNRNQGKNQSNFNLDDKKM